MSDQVAKISALSHELKGIARIEGKVTFVEGALPDETISLRYLRRKKDFDEGALVSVLEPSTLRVKPACPHFGMCGGCAIQHIAPSAQLAFKQTQLLDLLARFAHVEPREILAPLSAEVWHYRNKARLSVRYVAKKQSTLVGFREKHNPRYLADIQSCAILHPKIDKDLLALRALLSSLEDKSTIAQIELAAGDEEVALIFRNLSPICSEDAAKIRDFARNHQYRVFLQPKGPDSVSLFYPEDGRKFLSYRLPDYDLEYFFHPTDFTQIHPGLNRKLVPFALDLLNLQASDEVLDLCCGLGNFSLALARHAKQVIGVEISETMVQRASQNAKHNHLNNCEFLAANLDDPKAIANILKNPHNKILLDPPRTGAFELVKQISEAERIVYVSCNPATLARDLDVLINQKGYILEKAGVMDMFPHTAHVESIALLLKP